MVLFNDTLPPKPKTFWSKFLTWNIRLLLLFIALFFLFVGCLNLIQGNGETQKSGIEKTISGLTHKDTHIRELKTFELFPEIILDFNGIKNGLFSDQHINIQEAFFQAPGVLMMTRNGLFKDIDLKKIDFLKNNDLIHSIETIEIIHKEKDNEESTPYVSLQFSFPLLIELRFEIETVSNTPSASGEYTYKIKSHFPFSLHWEDKVISGHFFGEGGKYYITGTGQNLDASEAPFFSIDHTNVSCFIGEFNLSDYTVSFKNGLMKTESMNPLHDVFPLKFNFFTQGIEILDLGPDPLFPPDPKALDKSLCSPYT